MSASLEIAGVLLAAGESRRMGFPKPLLRLDGETFVEHLARLMLELVPSLMVVTGACHQQVTGAIPADARIRIVHNPRFASGQFSSLKAALARVDPAIEAVLVHLVDHPLIARETLRRMVEAANTGDNQILIARHQGRRGHPIVFKRALFDELLDAPEERGAKVVVDRLPERVRYVDVDDRGVLLDLDTPQELAQAGLSLPKVPPPR